MINSGAIDHLSISKVDLKQNSMTDIVKFEIYGIKNEYVALLDKTGLFVLTKNQKILFEEEKVYTFVLLQATDNLAIFSKHLGYLILIDSFTGIIDNKIGSKNENLEFSFLAGITSYQPI